MTDPKKLCFVIGPIGDEDSEQRVHADWLYTGIIVPVFDQHFPEFEVQRADKIPTPGMVSSQIINRLHDAELVIADLSFHNANAFYEMSIRHNVGKPIIHMIRKGERIPFDVIPHRAIPFALAKPDDQMKARELLMPSVEAAIEPGFKADNPIQHARGRLEIDTQASPAMKVLADEIQGLKTQLASTHALAVSAAEDARAARPTINAQRASRYAAGLLGFLNEPAAESEIAKAVRDYTRYRAADTIAGGSLAGVDDAAVARGALANEKKKP